MHQHKMSVGILFQKRRVWILSAFYNKVSSSRWLQSRGSKMVYAPFQTRFLANFRKSLTTPTLFTRKYVENCFCIRDDKNEYQKYYTES